jgi:hypothetical protein
LEIPLFKFALEYANKRVQASQEGLKLNGTISLVYTNNVNKPDGSTQTVQKNTEALVVAIKKNGLEVNTDKISNVSKP